MAELLLGNDRADPNSLGFYLQGFLTDEYIIVAGATVLDYDLDAVVIGPQGLFALHSLEPGIEPAAGTGQEVHQAIQALRGFLRERCPDLRPGLHHLLVLTSQQAGLIAPGLKELVPVTKDSLAETIIQTEAPPQGDLLDAGTRGTLAQELAQARGGEGLAVSKRATTPFVFRSGGLFGSGKKVWTVRAAIRHMDRYPEDGYFHLRNGTIIRWFAEQGAQPLADLGQEILREPATDTRSVLELFLVESGLVHRAPPSVRPRRINLGPVLSGESAESRLQLRKGRGRGYLFGDLRTSTPWLRVDPRTFDGGPLQASVTADTAELLISHRPWQAEVIVEPGAAEEGIAVPVSVRVVGMPTALDRYLVRPLAGLLAAGLLGGGLGWCLGHQFLPEPGWFTGLDSFPISWTASVTILIGLFWALLGCIRGVLQPLAWPIGYALRRWLLRTLAWMAALSLFAVVLRWSLGQVDPGLGAANPYAITGSILLFAWALAIVPAVVGEVRSAPAVKGATAQPTRRLLLRPALVGLAGVGLALLLVVGVQALGPTWNTVDVGGAMSTVESWFAEHFATMETGIDGAVDQYYLRYHDRRATAVPTALPATDSAAP